MIIRTAEGYVVIQYRKRTAEARGLTIPLRTEHWSLFVTQLSFGLDVVLNRDIQYTFE